MIHAAALAIACIPLGIYLLGLGGINLRRRPVVVSGWADLSGLCFAVSGLVVVGPLAMFLPETAVVRFGPFVWGLVLSFYILCALLILLVSRPRVVIFNITRQQFWPVLEQVVRRLDGEASIAGDAVHLRSLGVQFHLEAAPDMRNLMLVSTGEAQSFSQWKRLQRELAETLRALVVEPNPRGFTFCAVGLFFIGWPVVQLLHGPAKTVAQANAVEVRAVAEESGTERKESYGPRKETEAPEGAIVVAAQEEGLGEKIANAAAGAVFYFKAGSYLDLQIEPKAGQKFIGEYGAVLKSAKRLYAFDCFDRPVEEVAIENLVIDGYAPPVQCGAISGGKHWHVANCEVQNSTTGGIQLMGGSTVEGCSIHDCGQIGIKLFGEGSSLRRSEIASNNLQHKYDVYDEAGGSKFWQTKGVMIEENYFHDNVGCGIWLDCDNSGTVRNNRCENNTLAGIYQEIGGQLLIEGNTCIHDGTEYDVPNWLHGAGIAIEASQDVTVRKNTVRDCANGVGVIATSRGEARWTIKNIVVKENNISMSKGRSGVVTDGKAPAPWGEVHFEKNEYTLVKPEMFAWKGKTISYRDWQGAGEDAGSTFVMGR